MNPMISSMATIVISTIYAMWHSHSVVVARRQELLRERVAYMLWQMAKRAG